MAKVLKALWLYMLVKYVLSYDSHDVGARILTIPHFFVSGLSGRLCLYHNQIYLIVRVAASQQINKCSYLQQKK